MTGERITAEQAVTWGLAWKAVDPEALIGEAEALLERLSTGPTLAYAAVRRTARAALDLGFAQALDVEREAQGDAGRTADFKEGASAFLARRPVQFTGR
ncbi:1,2-epoxyphenylacetyl-CoA isomerase [compost metagenome]